MLVEALQEHRRKNNIFEVGDWITIELEEQKIVRLHSQVFYDLLVKDCVYFRHSTEEEIEIGMEHEREFD